MWNDLAIGVPTTIFLWSFGSLVFDKLAKWSFEFRVDEWIYIRGQEKLGGRYIQMSKKYCAEHGLSGKYARVIDVRKDIKKREIQGVEAFFLPSFQQLQELKATWDKEQKAGQEASLRLRAEWDKDYEQMTRSRKVIPYNYEYTRPRLYQARPFSAEGLQQKAIYIPIKHARKMPARFDPVTQTLIRQIDKPKKGGEKRRKGMHSRLFNIIVWGSAAIAIGSLMIDFAIHVNTVVPIVWNTFVAHK